MSGDIATQEDTNRINKSGAIFDKEKLNWMNKEYIKKISSTDFENIIINILAEQKISNSSININAIIQYAQNRVNQLTKIWDEIQCFYIYNKTEERELKKYSYQNLFLFWIEKLQILKKVNEEQINSLIADTKENLHISGKDFFIPMRIGLIDKIHGPDLFTIINILGINECINRLKQY